MASGRAPIDCGRVPHFPQRHVIFIQRIDFTTRSRNAPSHTRDTIVIMRNYIYRAVRVGLNGEQTRAPPMAWHYQPGVHLALALSRQLSECIIIKLRGRFQWIIFVESRFRNKAAHFIVYGWISITWVEGVMQVHCTDNIHDSRCKCTDSLWCTPTYAPIHRDYHREWGNWPCDKPLQWFAGTDFIAANFLLTHTVENQKQHDFDLKTTEA